jgi:PEGA domain
VLHRFYPPAPKPAENVSASPETKLPSGATLVNTTSGTQNPTSLGLTVITSEPDGAEIFLDDKFVGTTPASLRIPEGNHHLVLKSVHYSDWSRAINILKDSTATVKATMEPL